MASPRGGEASLQPIIKISGLVRQEPQVCTTVLYQLPWPSRLARSWRGRALRRRQRRHGDSSSAQRHSLAARANQMLHHQASKNGRTKHGRATRRERVDQAVETSGDTETKTQT